MKGEQFAFGPDFSPFREKERESEREPLTTGAGELATEHGAIEGPTLLLTVNKFESRIVEIYLAKLNPDESDLI